MSLFSSNVLKKNTQRGFTLIELLVVISIIGLLSSVVLASLSGARESARDARRQQDMRQFEIGAELYYQEHSHYPTEIMCDSSIGASSDNACPDLTTVGDGWNTSSSFYDLVDEGFMSSLPTDPVNDANYYYHYEPDNDGNGPAEPDNFCIRARLEAGGFVYAHAGKPTSEFGGCGQ